MSSGSQRFPRLLTVSQQFMERSPFVSRRFDTVSSPPMVSEGHGFPRASKVTPRVLMDSVGSHGPPFAFCRFLLVSKGFQGSMGFEGSKGHPAAGFQEFPIAVNGF